MDKLLRLNDCDGSALTRTGIECKCRLYLFLPNREVIVVRHMDLTAEVIEVMPVILRLLLKQFNFNRLAQDVKIIFVLINNY